VSKTPPVLLIAWKRPDTLRKTIAAVRAAAPTRVYVSCDGPNTARLGEAEAVDQTRQTIDQEINWDCRLEKLYSEKNLGCRYGVSKAICWFFEQESEGIILEDDCVAHSDFFSFCSALLEKYRGDESICCITGNNFQNGQQRGDTSYYFSKYPHCWGWATWRRAWDHYSPNFDFWPQWKRSAAWRQLFLDARERRHWEAVFDKVYAGQLDSWASAWLAAVWKVGGLTATPSQNLVTNIGFGVDATHTKRRSANLSQPAVGLRRPMRHPTAKIAHSEADRYVFETVFNGGRHGGTKAENNLAVLLSAFRRFAQSMRMPS
jgi:hypothetical protein